MCGVVSMCMNAEIYSATFFYQEGQAHNNNNNNNYGI